MKQKSLTKNSLYYLIYNTLNILFPFVTGIYVSRTLLQVNIGDVAYAQNIVQYFVTFAYLGIPTYGMREIAKIRNDKNKVNKLFSELFTINCISTVIFTLLYTVMIFSVSQFRDSLTLYLITGGLLALNALNISWLYEGLEEFGFISVRNIIFKIVAFTLLILLVRDKDDFLFYAAITTIGTAGNYIVNALYVPRFVKYIRVGLSFKEHLKPILYLMAIYLAIEIYTLVDITMIGNMCDKTHVAVYSYASRIHKMLLQVINSFTVVIVPRIALYYKERNKNEFNAIITNTFKLLLLLSIPMVVGIFFVGNEMITLLYGDAYINSALVLKMLSLMLIISPLGYLLGSRVMLVTGNESKMLKVVAIGAVVNVIGNYCFIQLFEEFGAALASVLSETVVMIIYVSYGKKYFKLSYVVKDVLKILTAAAVMGGVLLMCDSLLNLGVLPKLIIQIVVAVIVYFGLLIVFCEDVVEVNKRKILGKVFRR